MRVTDFELDAQQLARDESEHYFSEECKRLMDADVFDKSGRNRPTSEPSHGDIVAMANDLGCRVCGDYEQLREVGICGLFGNWRGGISR